MFALLFLPYDRIVEKQITLKGREKVILRKTKLPLLCVSGKDFLLIPGLCYTELKMARFSLYRERVKHDDPVEEMGPQNPKTSSVSGKWLDTSIVSAACSSLEHINSCYFIHI